MLLQQILFQLDGELGRLHELRAVVAGLSKSPAVVRTLKSNLSQLLQVKEPHAKGKGHPEAAPGVPAVLPRRGRPRRIPEAVPPAEPIQTLQAKPSRISLPQRARKPAVRSRPVESTALSRAAPSGPVVVSAAALAAERATRTVAKKDQAKLEQEAALRPEIIAREMAARWLAPAKS